MIWKALLLTVFVAPAIGLAAVSEETQQGSLKRATLQTGEFPPGYETVMIVAQMEPVNAPAGILIQGLKARISSREKFSYTSPGGETWLSKAGNLF